MSDPCPVDAGNDARNCAMQNHLPPRLPLQSDGSLAQLEQLLRLLTQLSTSLAILIGQNQELMSLMLQSGSDDELRPTKYLNGKPI